MLMLFAFFIFNNIYGQDILKQINGKWKLETVEVSNETYLAIDVFGTSDIYQIYKASNKFKGIVGDESEEGEWKLAKDKKTIQITNKEVKTTFTIISFEKNKMSLELNQEGQVLQLNYKKQ